MSAVTQRNKCLDAFKGIACIAVVLLHVNVPFENVSEVLHSIARFAVPLFFMVSGYYCYYEDNHVMSDKLPKKIRHILSIGIIGLIYWIIVQMGVNLFGLGEHNLLETLKEMVTTKAIVDFVVLNADPVINILWFIFALLYTYILVYLFAKLDKVNVLLKMTPILLIAHFCMGNIAFYVGLSIRTELYRNCWFMGLPLFMIGYYIRKSSLKISKRVAKNLIFIGFVLSILEGLIFIGQELYIGSIITAASMIIYSEHVPEKTFINLLYTIGNRYSLFMYITHISVGIVIDRIAKMCGIVNNLGYMTLKPLIVIAMTIVFAMVFYNVIDIAERGRVKWKMSN